MSKGTYVYAFVINRPVKRESVPDDAVAFAGGGFVGLEDVDARPHLFVALGEELARDLGPAVETIHEPPTAEDLADEDAQIIDWLAEMSEDRRQAVLTEAQTRWGGTPSA